MGQGAQGNTVASNNKLAKYMINDGEEEKLDANTTNTPLVQSQDPIPKALLGEILKGKDDRQRKSLK